MAGKLTWNGDRALEAVDAAVINGIATALFDPFVLYLTQTLTAAGQPPSLPGEVPHYLRGASSPDSLVNSLMIWAVPSECRVVVGSNSRYALALEMGNGPLLARPFMGPALTSKLDDVADAIADHAADAFAERTPMPYEDVNLNPLTVEGSSIPSRVPDGKGNILSGRKR